MYQSLLIVHSYSRWFVLIFLVYAIFKALAGLLNKKPFDKQDKIAALLALIFVHTQFLIGLLLYFQSSIVKIFLQDPKAGMKLSALRFWGMEHITLMITAVFLITVGYSIAKRSAQSDKKFRTILIFYAIGLFLILASIPWAGVNARPLFRF